MNRRLLLPILASILTLAGLRFLAARALTARIELLEPRSLLPAGHPVQISGWAEAVERVKKESKWQVVTGDEAKREKVYHLETELLDLSGELTFRSRLLLQGKEVSTWSSATSDGQIMAHLSRGFWP
jgi:hypothetical protein